MIHKQDASIPLEKEQIAYQFSRAAKTYDEVSQLQQDMSARLVSQLAIDQTGRLVDFGCGTGASLVALAQSHSGLTLAGLDLAEGMVEVARQKLATKVPGTPVELWIADLTSSNLPDQSVEIVFSNAAIQWSNLRLALTEMHRVLKPGGMALVSTFGPSTLAEVRDAWQAIGDSQPRVHTFSSPREIEQELIQTGFDAIEIETDFIEVFYPSARDLFRSIKQLGATNADASRSSGLLGRQKFQRLCQWFEDRRIDGRLKVSFEPIYVRARQRSGPPV